ILGLVAFQSLPLLTSANDLSPAATETSVTSAASMLHRVLSRNSMGALLIRSTLYFLTRKTCGASDFFTYISSSPFFAPSRTDTLLPSLSPTVMVTAGGSRPASASLTPSAKSLAFQAASADTTPLAVA